MFLISIFIVFNRLQWLFFYSCKRAYPEAAPFNELYPGAVREEWNERSLFVRNFPMRQ